MELAEGDEVEIEDVIPLLVFAQCSQKIDNAGKAVRPSSDLQNLVIEALDAEAVSQSGYFSIFFIQRLYEIQHFLFRIRIQFYAQLRYIFHIEFGPDMFDDIDDPS